MIRFGKVTNRSSSALTRLTRRRLRKGTAPDNSATVLILADPTVKVLSSSNGDEGGVNPQVTIGMESAARRIVVSYSVTPGPTPAFLATPGSDFTPLSGSVTIPAGSTTAVITVPVIDDDTLESAGVSDDQHLESLTAANTLDSDVKLDPDAADVTIQVSIGDNDSAYVGSRTANTDASDNPSSVDDGLFTVRISKASDTPTRINYAITGSATAGSDYVTLLGSVDDSGECQALSFAIPVSVLNDTVIEGSEDMSHHSDESIDATPTPHPRICCGAIGRPD